MVNDGLSHDWCDKAEFGMSSSCWISPTTSASGCAESSNWMMRKRASVPIAENMSAYLTTFSEGFCVCASSYFDICSNLNKREGKFKIGLLYSVFFSLMTRLTIFGLLAVTAMLVFYALEKKGSWFILAFAGSCLLGSAYGFLQGAWPFGLVEAVWAVVAARRWWSVRSSHKRD